MKLLRDGLLAAVKWADRENRFFYSGAVLLGAGCSARFGLDIAAMVLGVILILAVNPIRGWWTDGRTD